jgi:high-affinity nickel-transport protein
MEIGLFQLGIWGVLGVLGGALALGIRHGIDWDHIAAIADITSTTSAASQPEEDWLIHEPGVLLTNERDHEMAEFVRRRPIAGGEAIAMELPSFRGPSRSGVASFVASHRSALLLGGLYAIGHGTIVTILGLTAILAAGFLPSWIDPVMERAVGITLVFLAGYLFYSLFRYFRGQGEFHIRSRWMLIFAGIRNAANWLWSRLRGRSLHTHVHVGDRYGPRTAYAVGLIHGIGAETGTQVLIIAAAAGASTKAMGVAALLFFVAGLLISNSFVTVATAAGFVSAQRRQLIYVLAGLLAAVFSLVIGLVFLSEASGILPDLGSYFRWVGGPNA